MGEVHPEESAVVAVPKKRKKLKLINPFKKYKLINPFERIPLPVIKPGAKFRNLWDALMFVIITYNCIMTPVSITMLFPKSPLSGLGLVDTICDVIFVFDSILHFFFAYVDIDTKELVTDHLAIKDHYLNSQRFVVNLVAVTPLIFIPVVQDPSSGVSNKYWAIFALPRMVRIGHFVPQLRAIRVLVEEYMGIAVNAATFRMGIIFVFSLFMCTIFGSLYFYIACPWKFDGGEFYYIDEAGELSMWNASFDSLGVELANSTAIRPRRIKIEACDLRNRRGLSMTWAQADPIVTESTSSEFARAIYYMMQTLFTIGYGDSVVPQSTKEIVFGVIIMMAGAYPRRRPPPAHARPARGRQSRAAWAGGDCSV